MIAEILTIGDEVCRGDIVDSNKSWLAQTLTEVGVLVNWHTSCRDNADDMVAAIEAACARADVVVTTGGLGPTVDDLTVDTMAALVASDIVFDTAAQAKLEAVFSTGGREVTDLVLRQVRLPEAATVIPNTVGLAPGFQLRHRDTEIVCLPGVPRELKAMVTSSLVPWLQANLDAAPHESRTYRTFGKTESAVAKLLAPLESVHDAVSFHYRATMPEIIVRVAGTPPALAAVDSGIRELLGKYLISTDGASLSEVVGRLLVEAKATVAVAESCTGGMTGALLTEIPGASRYFLGGVLAYDNEVKVQKLNVSPTSLASHGAVSEAVVSEMASGVRDAIGANWGIAISGTAGPGGGTEDKPVGTVWLAIAGPDGLTTRKIFFPRTRDLVRKVATHSAVDLLRRRLLGIG